MLVFFYILVSFAISVLIFVAEWKIYEKAGKPGWAMLVPIYNVLVMLEIVGKPWWWILLIMVPGVNVVIVIWMVNLLSLSFGQTSVFTVGIILLPFVFIPLLGLGEAKYVGPAGSN